MPDGTVHIHLSSAECQLTWRSPYWNWTSVVVVRMPGLFGSQPSSPIELVVAAGLTGNSSRMPIVLGGIHWRTPAHSLNCLPGMEIGCIRKNAVRIADGAGMVPCRFRRGRFGISSSGVPTVWKPCRPACRPAGKFSSPTRLVTCPSADGESPRKAGRDPLVKAGGRCKKSRQRNC